MKTSKKTVACIVLNNYTNDSRVHKMTQSLKHDYEVKIVALLKGRDVSQYDEDNGVPVERIKLITMNLPKGNFFGLLKYLEFFLKIIIRYRKFDIWHCNDFEPFLIGLIAKKIRRKLKLVYDCHEFEAEKNGQSKLSSKFVKFIEKKFIKKASNVITVSQGIASEYRKRYGLKKVDLILNAPHYNSGATSNIFREKFSIPNEHLIFIYQGVLVKGRGIELLLRTFKELKSEKVSLVFMGNGVLKSMILECEKNCSNIHYQESVPYNEVLKHTNSADIGIISVENTCLSYYYSMPNKLFEYMQAGLSVLTTPLHDVRQIVEKEKIGWMINGFTVADFKKAILDITERDHREKVAKSNSIAKNYCWEKEEKKLLGVYKNL